jgi:WD40 repeat protein
VNSCRVNANGTVIVSASFDKTLKVWDASTGVERFTLQGHTLTVTGCAVGADGSVIVSVSRDKTLKIWNGQTSQCLATLFVDEPLLDCACSADAGHIVAVGSGGVYFLRLVR